VRTSFNDLKDLLDTLKREETLLSEMFNKRKTINYKISDALELVDNNYERMKALLQLSVIQESENFLELDVLFLDFFEQVLGINEDINLSYVNENIKKIKENINYYLQEDENGKYKYLVIIKRTFRRIGDITLKNVINLSRNIENTFKNEPNYEIKQSKLGVMDEKRTNIKDLIDKTSLLIDSEFTFFKNATDEELKVIIDNLKHNLNECTHNLIEIEKQIISFLNKIKLQSKFLKKIRKLKYLRDQSTIKPETNIRDILLHKNHLIFATFNTKSLNLSIDFLRDDEQVRSIIEKVAKNNATKLNFKPLIADNISYEFLENSEKEEIMINLEEVKNQFVATSDNLFNFILNYDFLKEVDFNERVTIFCQMASQFELELKFEDEYQINNNIEYTLIYPK
jgi:hypothetical protein